MTQFIKGAFLTLITSAMVSYLVFSYVFFSWNPATWGYNNRALSILLTFLMWFFVNIMITRLYADPDT